MAATATNDAASAQPARRGSRTRSDASAAPARPDARGDESDAGREHDQGRVEDQLELRDAEVELTLERRQADQQPADERALLEPDEPWRAPAHRLHDARALAEQHGATD